jgi:hypothetical protein
MRTAILLLAVAFALDAYASPHHGQNNATQVNLKIYRKDPAFVSGFDEGYRRGANDSEAMANYNDQNTAAYQDATDGYTTQYGEKATYQQRFRLGYIAGYKSGWDYNAGMYNPMGAGSW